ncbi:MAG: MobA/MobL family protein [Sideroxydans sp.]|nr:MobA/MobL family protein [Sideroxydans sp.]
MAEYHLHAKTHSRGAGKGAGGHVRYILREGAYAQKTVEQVNGAVVERVRIDRAGEVVHAESGHLPAWAKSPSDYWDAADQYERANGTVYREIEFALPKELSDNENIELARSFAEELAAVPGGTTPYTLAIHRSEKDPNLLHCHLMLSDKVNDGIERDPALWFRRAANPGKDPARGGAPKTQARIEQEWLGDVVRPLWERLANDALAHAEVDARIDHRSLEARRIEQEALAAQAMRDHHERAAWQHARRAEALDRPPEPKKGRVLTHAGPEKAPGRAAMVVDFEAAKAARAQAVEFRRLAEAVVARDRQAVEQAQAVLSAARARQALRDPFDKMRIRERWRKRRQVRVDRVLDAETLAETRNGFRGPADSTGPANGQSRPSWAGYRERMLTEAYGAEIGKALGRWVRVERDLGSRTLGRAPSLHIHNKVMDITDYGDRLVALQAASSPGGKAQEIDAMLKIAGAKGWKTLTVTGSADFQMRAGAAALAAGFTLTDGDLTARIAAQQEQDAEAQRAKDLEVAPVLAEWLRAHPKQAQAQRLAGGQIPLLCPEGLDRAALQRPVLWDAAAAWTVGRYGETAQWQALSKDPDPLKAQAVAAGREAALNAWAREGITLRVGQDAPQGVRGLGMSRTAEITRPQVERWAQDIRERQQRSGVALPIVVTFGGDVSITKKVLVLEHLLRQSVSLDAPALEKAGGRYALDQARERLNTHEPDGAEQAWYTRAERVKKLDALALHLERHGSGNSGKHFQEAGFVVDKEGFYAYPDPGLPGVRAAWDALAAAQRKEREADIQQRAESVGYRLESGQWSPEQRKADPEHQRLAQEIQDDPSLKGMANTAYQQGIGRARQEREARLEQDRKVLRAAAHKLGRRAEKGGSNAGKQIEIQREFVELIQRGAGLGVDEKALSKSLQGGREAYRQEKALSRSRGMEL